MSLVQSVDISRGGLLRLTYDKAAVDRELSILAGQPDKMRKALAQAINRTLQGLRTDLKTAISGRSYLRKATIQSAIVVAKASWKRADRMEGKATVNSKRRRLMEYKVYPTTGITSRSGTLPAGYKPISYALAPGGKRFGNQTPGGGNKMFLAVLGGHRGVYAREGRDRLPVFEGTGPSVQFWISREGDQVSLLASADMRFNKALMQQVTFFKGGGDWNRYRK